MEKKDLIANDPMETRMIAFAETVRKIAWVIMIVLTVGAVLLGIAAGAGDLLIFAAIIIPAVILVLLVWLVSELVCLWLENQTEMHCYARTQTEILLEKEGKEKRKPV